MSGTSATAEHQAIWRQVVAKAWADPVFKSKLLSEPIDALVEAGIAWPAGLALRVHEATPTEVHLVLPPCPADELDDEALQGVAGGTGSSHHSSSHHTSSHNTGSNHPASGMEAWDTSPEAAAIEAYNNYSGGGLCATMSCSL